MANRGYSEIQALNVVTVAGATTSNGKHIIVEGGLTGLRACGALDYLLKHCGYSVSYTEKKKKD